VKLIFFVFICFSGAAFAKSLGFMESHALRLSSQDEVNQWLIPMSSESHQNFGFTVFYSGNREVKDVYDDLQSKDQGRIEKRIDSSYGSPYDASAKIQAKFDYANFRQTLSTNAGAVLVVTDPIFPELQGFLFHDYMGSSSYRFVFPNAMVKPQVSYGYRKLMNRRLTAGQVASEKINVKLDKSPSVGLMEFSLESKYFIRKFGEIFFEVNSLPLTNYEYSYYETNVGYRSPLFARLISFYAAYTPFYGGHYDVSRTFKLGTEIRPVDHLRLSLFTFDEFYLGGEAQLRFKNFELALLTFERSHDDYGYQKSRQYGAFFRLLI
jgi:hypothetical protein